MLTWRTSFFGQLCLAGLLVAGAAYGATPFVNGSQLSISGGAIVGFNFLSWTCVQPGDAVCLAPPPNTGDFAVGSSTGSFAQYNVTFGKITNLTLAGQPLNQTFSDPGWITFDVAGVPNVTMELTFIPLGTDTPSPDCVGVQHCTPTNAALVTPSNPGGLSAFNLDKSFTGTTASFAVMGIAHDTLGTPSFGFTGILTAQFAGLTPDQVLAQVGANGLPATYSFNFKLAPLPPAPTGCPATPGFWKHHTFPDTLVFPVTVAGVSYSAGDFLSILNNPGGGNAVQIMSFQLVAAILNIAAGGKTNANVNAELLFGESLLQAFQGFAGNAGSFPISMLTGFVPPSSPLGGQMTNVGNFLTGYNTGFFNSCNDGAGLLVGNKIFNDN